jgi:hypothetical protein
MIGACGFSSDPTRQEPVPPARRICDGGPGVRFAMRSASGGTNLDAPRSDVLYELGHTYLFVDGACHYWALGSEADGAGGWGSIHEGTLTEERERALSLDSFYGDWGDLAGSWGSVAVSDGGGIVFFDAERVIGYSGPCVAPSSANDPERSIRARHLCQIWRPWIDKMYAEGTPVTGPMRISVFLSDGFSDAGEPRFDWPISRPIAEVLDDFTTAGVGRSHLIDNADDVARLRSMRQQYRDLPPGYRYGFLVIRNDDAPTTPYFLYARDAISALEDERGLIPAPSADVTR